MDPDLIEKLLRQIIEILETSTIAGEGGQGTVSKFWAAYKKISGEYDDKLVQNYSGSIDTIMVFAGLFSAVNIAFVIAMQPNPADTTNDLLVQLMQNAPWNAHLQVALSASVAYSSSKTWMQVLAYMSLTFSLLAALGAVLCKEWLGYYKTDDNRAQLEDKYQRRHRRFEELEKMHFDSILHSLPVLLQISLFLFILSMVAAMWKLHRTVSLLIIVPTTCGAFFYVHIVWKSLDFHDSSFRTPISIFIRHFLDLLPKNHGNREDENHTIASAILWILKTSTNPDIYNLALDLMLTNLSQQSQEQSSSLIKKVLGMFQACFDPTQSDHSKTVSLGRALINISWKHNGATEILHGLLLEWEHWSSWRSLYLPQALEHCKTSFCRMKETVSANQREQVDNTRIALRMALGAGMDKFLNPDRYEEYVELVWHGQFGLELNLPDVDWLMDCATHFRAAQDFDAAGDALLLLSDLKNIREDSIVPFLKSGPRSPTLRHCALRAACRAVDINSPCDSSFVEAVLTAISPPIQRGHNGGDIFANAIHLLEFTVWPHNHPLVGSPLIDIQRLIFLVLPAPSLENTVEFGRYCHALIHFMSRASSIDCKRAAVHIAYRIRRDLAMITGTPSLSVPVSLQTDVLSKLSPALLTMVPSEFNSLDYFFYLRLIFTLASRPNWLPRLVEDGHIERCIRIIPVFCDQPPSSFFYLAGIFLRIEVASGGQSGLVITQSITQSQWWDLTRMAWHVAGRSGYSDGSNLDVLDDSGMKILEDLVTITKSCMPQDASASDLQFLRDGLSRAIRKLESHQLPSKEIIYAMKDLKRYEIFEKTSRLRSTV